MSKNGVDCILIYEFLEVEQCRMTHQVLIPARYGPDDVIMLVFSRDERERRDRSFYTVLLQGFVELVLSH